MNTGEYFEFKAAWNSADAMSVKPRNLEEDVLSSIFDILMPYELEHVKAALQIHSRKSKYSPTPADICEIIDDRTGVKHIGPDEAWGIVLKSFDERETVVVTKEIMQARDFVLDIYDSGDLTGARMAFRDAYNRIMLTTHDRPQWFISAGFDSERRAMVIEKAKEQGRLPKSSGSEYLLGHDKPITTVAGLIESSRTKDIGKTELKRLKADLR